MSGSLFGPAGSSVVTASAGTARLRLGCTLQPELEKFAQLPSRIESIDAEDGRLRVTTVDGRVYLLDPDTGEKLGVEEGVPSDGLRKQRPTAPPREIRKNTVVLRGRRTEDGARGSSRPCAVGGVLSDGALLATASRDHDVRIWDGTTGEGFDCCSTTPASATRASARTDAGWCRRRSGRRRSAERRDRCQAARARRTGDGGAVRRVRPAVVTGGVDVES